MDVDEGVIDIENSSSKTEFLFTDVIRWENPEEMTKPWVANPHFIPSVLVYSLCLILGSAGNGLVIWAMQCGRSKSVTGMFLVSLAVSDVLLLFSAPADVASNFVKSNKGGSVSCKMVGYGRKLSAFATVFNLMAITVERYIVIVHPMRAKLYVTMKNCKRALVLVWTFAVIMALPNVFVWEVQPFYYGKFDQLGLIRESVVKVLVCDETTLEGGYIVFYYFIMLFILPLALDSVCYSQMIYVLWSSTTDPHLTTHTGTGPKKHSNGDIQLIVTAEPDSSCAVELVSADVTEFSKDNNTTLLQLDTHATKCCSNYHLSATSFVRTSSATASPHHNFPRSRAESLAYTECPSSLLKTSRNRKAINRILNSKQRQKKETIPAANNLLLQPSNKNIDLKVGRRQVIKMLLVVTLAFMVCWGPLVIFEVLRFYGMIPFQDSSFAAKLIVNLLPYCHCCLNPIIYGFMSKNFRTSLRKACAMPSACRKTSEEESLEDEKLEQHFSANFVSSTKP